MKLKYPEFTPIKERKFTKYPPFIEDAMNKYKFSGDPIFFKYREEIIKANRAKYANRWSNAGLVNMAFYNFEECIEEFFKELVHSREVISLLKSKGIQTVADLLDCINTRNRGELLLGLEFNYAVAIQSKLYDKEVLIHSSNPQLKEI